MSKLEEQKALPRRYLFKLPEKIAKSASRTPRFLRKVEITIPFVESKSIVEFKPKRKAKKAKRKS